MKDEQQKFLAIAGQLPARLTAEQTAWVLGCQLHDMPILIASRLLKPLGNPAQNSIKFFAASEVLALSRERSWLMKATTAINVYWHSQNAKRKGRLCSFSQSDNSTLHHLSSMAGD